MGGLLCTAAIAELIDTRQEQVLSRVGGLVLMATPQTGSQRVLTFLSWFFEDFHALKPHGEFVRAVCDTLTNNRVVLDDTRAQSGDIVIPTWAVLGTSDHWVDKLSGGLNLPDSRKKIVRGSHTEIVKPRSKQSDAYQFIHDRLKEVWDKQKLKMSGVRVGGNTVLQVLTSDIGIAETQNNPAEAPEIIQEGSNPRQLATDECPVFESARQEAEKMCREGRPDLASRAFMEAVEREQRNHRHLCEKLFEGAILFDINAKNFDAAYAELCLVAETRHPCDRKGQMDYLFGRASEYEEQDRLKGDNGLRIAIMIFRKLAKDKGDV
jgi:hypothetical protein